MKILTNVQTSHLAGISQTFSSFVNFTNQDKKNHLKITGVEISPSSSLPTLKRKQKRKDKFTLITTECNYPTINEVTKNSNSLFDIENNYRELITKYKEMIKDEKPDVILLNGTYFMPWCLFKASQEYNIPIILHYHGVLSKEVAHWDEKPKSLLCQMEKSFDQKNLFYVFPSNLAKEVVENEVYGHKINNCSILPNPVPKHFFKINKKDSSDDIGIISRWSKIKNPSFIKRIAKYSRKHGNHFPISIVTDIKKDGKDYKELAGHVNFINPMSNNEIANFYGKVGIVISPSIFETYGNVAQEALATNTPALISSNMGVSETFKKLGLTDWIVNFSSAKNIYSKINELKKQEVGSKIRKIIYYEFSPEKIHGQMINIINSV